VTEWLNTADAAARCGGVTVRTLYRFINDGELPAYQLGRVYRLRAADVDEFLEGRRVKAGDLDRLVAPTSS
jgi:excisionase family DNA binding protein